MAVEYDNKVPYIMTYILIPISNLEFDNDVWC